MMNLEMTYSDFRNFEKLLNSTLEVMHHVEKESPQRENNILKSQAETLELKSQINQQLSNLENKIGKFRITAEAVKPLAKRGGFTRINA